MKEDEGTEKTKRRGWHITGWVVLVIAVYILLDSGLIPWGYVRSAPISGTIIDQETGQPISHAVISIRWPQLIGTMGGTIHVGSGTIKRIEVVSDEQGNYLVLGWKRSKWEIGEGGFGKDRPEMHIYAAGCWPRTLRNKKAGRLGWGEAWKAEWDGEDIELEPMHWQEWSREEWESKKKGRMAGGPSFEGCKWMEYPEYVVGKLRMAIRKIELFGQNEKKSLGWDDFFQAQEKKCGIDVFKYLQKYGLTHEEWEVCCAKK